MLPSNFDLHINLDEQATVAVRSSGTDNTQAPSKEFTVHDILTVRLHFYNQTTAGGLDPAVLDEGIAIVLAGRPSGGGDVIFYSDEFELVQNETAIAADDGTVTFSDLPADGATIQLIDGSGTIVTFEAVYTGSPAAGNTAFTAVQTGATGEESNDTISLTGHGFEEDEPVVFTLLTDGAGLSLATTYYVIADGLTADVFKVSTTLGGAAVDIDPDYSAISVYSETEEKWMAALVEAINESDLSIDSTDEEDGSCSLVQQIAGEVGNTAVTVAGVNVSSTNFTTGADAETYYEGELSLNTAEFEDFLPDDGTASRAEFLGQIQISLDGARRTVAYFSATALRDDANDAAPPDPTELPPFARILDEQPSVDVDGVGTGNQGEIYWDGANLWYCYTTNHWMYVPGFTAFPPP